MSVSGEAAEGSAASAAAARRVLALPGGGSRSPARPPCVPNRGSIRPFWRAPSGRNGGAPPAARCAPWACARAPCGSIATCCAGSGISWRSAAPARGLAAPHPNWPGRFSTGSRTVTHPGPGPPPTSRRCAPCSTNSAARPSPPASRRRSGRAASTTCCRPRRSAGCCGRPARPAIGSRFCCMTLRRSYAVQCLRDGTDVRQLQESLGHRHVETTLAYCRYLPPNGSDVLAGGPCAFRLAASESPCFPPALAGVQSSGP